MIAVWVWESITLDELSVILGWLLWDARQIWVTVIGVIQTKPFWVTCCPLKIIHKAPCSITTDVHPIMLNRCGKKTKRSYLTNNTFSMIFTNFTPFYTCCCRLGKRPYVHFLKDTARFANKRFVLRCKKKVPFEIMDDSMRYSQVTRSYIHSYIYHKTCV